MFVKMTDLKGRPIYLRAELVERVREPVEGEYTSADSIPGAVIMFTGGGIQAVQELPGETSRRMQSLKHGGEVGGPKLP